MKHMFIRAGLSLLFLAPLVAAQVVPQAVSASEAQGHLTRKVEPTVPALAKMAKVGGTVRLQLTISTSGDVVSVNVISGHPMLVGAAVEAAKKWKYKPFEVDGKAVPVTTSAELNFPGSMSEEESTARNKFFPVEQECRNLIKSGEYSTAEPKCRDAVEISNRLPDGVVLERSDARSLLGNCIFLQRRYTEAIPLYEEALRLDQGYRKPDDADLASDYWNLGRAYAMTGQLSKADGLYATAITTFEAAIVGLPEMKDNYTQRLKRTLNEYAQLKDAQGEGNKAFELRKKAAGL